MFLICQNDELLTTIFSIAISENQIFLFITKFGGRRVDRIPTQNAKIFENISIHFISRIKKLYI